MENGPSENRDLILSKQKEDRQNLSAEGNNVTGTYIESPCWG